MATGWRSKGACLVEAMTRLLWPLLLQGGGGGVLKGGGVECYCSIFLIKETLKTFVTIVFWSSRLTTLIFMTAKWYYLLWHENLFFAVVLETKQSQCALTVPSISGRWEGCSCFWRKVGGCICFWKLGGLHLFLEALFTYDIFVQGWAMFVLFSGRLGNYRFISLSLPFYYADC